MKFILTQLGLWLIKQSWFQFSVVKFITSVIEGTGSKIDDNILKFIKEHKRSIATIANKEMAKAESVVDERLAKAIKSVK